MSIVTASSRLASWSVRAVAAVLALLLLSGLVVGAAVSSRSSDDAPARAELTALLETGASTVHTATYDVELETMPGALVQLLVWQDPPLRRHELVIDAAGTLTRVAVIGDGTDDRRCIWEGAGPWRCELQPAGSPSEATGVLDRFRFALAAGQVDGTEATVGDRSARCFSRSDPASTDRLCLTEDGIVLRGAAGGSTLNLIDLRSTVDRVVFSPPG